MLKMDRMRGGEPELGLDYWCDALSWASHSAVQCNIAVCRGQRSGAAKTLSKHLQGIALPCIDFSQIIVCPRPPVSECRRLQSWAIQSGSTYCCNPVCTFAESCKSLLCEVECRAAVLHCGNFMIRCSLVKSQNCHQGTRSGLRATEAAKVTLREAH